MTPHPTLLLVEDDGDLAAMLTGLLRSEGYDVEVAGDGQRALHLGLTRSYDVVVLDRGLPAIDGLDLLVRLRSRGMTAPVLVLSALADPLSRVEGLDAGAEDYLGKPFDVEELLARLRALLRRHSDAALVLTVPGGVFEPEQRTVVSTGGTTIPLSGREAALLEVLARNPTRVFSRAELLDLAFDALGEGAVNTYVHYLRRKLGKRTVRTIHGLGYRLGSP